MTRELRASLFSLHYSCETFRSKREPENIVSVQDPKQDKSLRVNKRNTEIPPINRALLITEIIQNFQSVHNVFKCTD